MAAHPLASVPGSLLKTKREPGNEATPTVPRGHFIVLCQVGSSLKLYGMHGRIQVTVVHVVQERRVL